MNIGNVNYKTAFDSTNDSSIKSYSKTRCRGNLLQVGDTYGDGTVTIKLHTGTKKSQLEEGLAG